MQITRLAAVAAAGVACLLVAYGSLLTADPDRGPARGRPAAELGKEYTMPVERKELTPEEARVILRKGTEAPGTGIYTDHFEDGAYACRQCGALLYRSENKFHSGCGWPAFDLAIKGAVKRQPDADGRRTEIVCANCDGHLGHVFEGEGFTPRDTRHCVNSISMDFVPADEVGLGRAIFAGGCFWGVEYAFEELPGVLDARSGYIGGHTENPSYKEVCNDRTGHAEAVEVLYDPARIDFAGLAKVFFEIHDPTQIHRQGPDVGSQYRSAVFPVNDEQTRIAEELIAHLKKTGVKVATSIEPAGTFWPAEEYHQDYVQKHPARACHARTQRDWTDFTRP
jgi:peptide methionine sulfoxide reductase msrA/msrB